jgi:hypothetical protein
MGLSYLLSKSPTISPCSYLLYHTFTVLPKIKTYNKLYQGVPRNMNTFYYHSGKVHTAMSSFCSPSTHKKENNKNNKRKLNGIGRKERNK